MTLTEIRELTGLPFKRYNNQYVAPCYIDGSPHAAFNKIYTTYYDGSWWITEQGGEAISLQQWLKLYGDSEKRVPNTKMEEPPKIERKFVSQIIYGKTFPEIYQGNLFLALSRIFGVITTHEAFVRYSIGESSKRDTVFWYRNESGQWLHDQVVPYRTDGKRDKSLDMTGWRKCKSKDGYTGRGVFGGHLIRGFTGEICVVESEKTALIMSLVDKKNRLWVATGGSNKTAQIKENWTMFPDFDDAGKFWECLGCQNKGKTGCVIERKEGRRTKKWECQFGSKKVSHWFKGIDVSDGDDVADYVINKMRKKV